MSTDVSNWLDFSSLGVSPGYPNSCYKKSFQVEAYKALNALFCKSLFGVQWGWYVNTPRELVLAFPRSTEISISCRKLERYFAIIITIFKHYKVLLWIIFYYFTKFISNKSAFTKLLEHKNALVPIVTFIISDNTPPDSNFYVFFKNKFEHHDSNANANWPLILTQWRTLPSNFIHHDTTRTMMRSPLKPRTSGHHPQSTSYLPKCICPPI